MFDNHESFQYSFEPMDSEAQQHQGQRVPYAPPAQGPQTGGQPPKKHRRTGLKIAALAVACALVGGAGGGAIMAHFLRDDAASQTTAGTVAESTGGTANNTVATPVYSTNTGDKSLTPEEVYNRYVNSTVGITTSGTTTNFFGQPTQFAASGSGFIITADGYIVTNHHVIDGADSVTVTLYDGTQYDAQIIGSDESNDVALLKVDATNLQPVSIGNSDQVAVGEQVAAIGNPLGELTFSMTVGYISALDRVINTDGTPINMLQTDVAINSGNSGGPLFDMNGNVVGITTAKYSGSTSSGTSIEGIGFAIPINDVMTIVNDLMTYGYVTGQAYLGVSVQDLDALTARYYSLPVGVLVASVTEGSCAETAGVQQGDIITALDGVTVENYSDLATQLNAHSAGDTVSMEVYRSGQTLTLQVTLDEKRPEEATVSPTTQTETQTQQSPTWWPFAS